MELPDFDPAGKGPQGTGGIPPDALREALRDQGVDLISATERPEDSPAAREVLDRVAAELMRQQGVVDEGEAGGRPTTDPAKTAARKAATPASPEPSAAEPESGDDYAEQVRKLTEQYGDDFDGLAKSFAHVRTKLTRTSQEKNQEIADLQQQVATTNALLQSLLTGSSRTPDPGAALRRPAEPGQPEEEITDDYFRENPAAATARIVDRAVRQNLLAIEQARANLDEQRRMQEWEQTHAQEIDQLRPIMAQVYMEDKQLYDSLSPRQATANILKRARERSGAIRAVDFFEQLKAGKIPADAAAPGSAPGRGALPTGAAPRRPVGPVAGPPNGDWSKTQGFQRLIKHSDGSVDEMRAVMDVLKERGLGEHLQE